MNRFLAASCALTIAIAGLGLATAADRLEVATLVSPAGGPEGSYGTTVAIDEDRAAVGWSEIDDEGALLGRVTIYVRSPSGGWGDEQTLLSETPDDLFGSAIAIEGDRLVVGAPAPCPEAEEGVEITKTRGTVHVFQRSGAVWEQTATLRGAGACQRFGLAVALGGDRFAAGNRSDHDAVAAVAVYERKGAAWKRAARLRSPSPDIADDGFGASGLALDGASLAVGTPPADPEGQGRGHVHLYTRDAKRWAADGILRKPSGSRADLFGTSIDLDAGSMIVGDPHGVGSAHVFELQAGRWRHRGRLSPDTGGVGDRFGISVGIEGAFAAVGAAAAGSPAEAGVVHAFRERGGSWKPYRTFAASGGAAGDMLGTAVGVSDGFVIGGAPSRDTACGPNAGAAFVFALTGAGPGAAPNVQCGAAAGMSATVDSTVAVSTGAANVPISGTVTSLFSGFGPAVLTLRGLTTGTRSSTATAVVTCAEATATECTWSSVAPRTAGRYSVIVFPRDAYGRHGAPSTPTEVIVVAENNV